VSGVLGVGQLGMENISVIKLLKQFVNTITVKESQLHHNYN